MKRTEHATEKLSDAELSKKLGHYQKMASMWLLIGLIGVVSGTIAFFATQDTTLKIILVTELFFGGVCCAMFLGGGAQKKLKALLQTQLGDFFRTELENAFGADVHTPEMQIDELLLKALCLLDQQWEECTVENLHEGSYHNVRFSAANVRLDHVYERAIPHEGLETCRNMVFRGLVLRCKTRISAASPVRVNARTEDSPRGIITGNAAFDRSFCVTAASEQDAFQLLTPQFLAVLKSLDGQLDGQLLGFYWSESVLTLALETDYGFASIASDVDLRNLDAARQSYINSLQALKDFLDLLLQNTALFTQA